MKKKVKGKKKASVQQESGEEKKPSRRSTSTGHTLTLKLSEIIMPPKKLIVRETLGDVTELLNSIKKTGQLQSLLVRPSAKKQGYYELLSGHRRFNVMGQIGIKEANVIVREDLADDDVALGAIVSENTSEARSEMTALELARVFKTLFDTYGGDSHSISKTAKACSTTSENVRRHMGFLDVPKPLQERLTSGDVSKEMVVKFNQISDESARKAALKAIVGGEVTSTRELVDFSNDFRDAKKASGDADAAEEPKDGRRVSSPARVSRTMKEIRSMCEQLTLAMVQKETEASEASGSAKDEATSAALLLRERVVTLGWCAGDITKLDPDRSSTVRWLDTMRASVTETTEVEEVAEEEETPAQRKKGKKGKKKKARQLEEAAA